MHARPKVSELFALSIQRLKKHFAGTYHIRVFAVISDAESEAVCNQYGIPFHFTENLPLGRKWNSGLKEVMAFDFDYLLIGSDDDIMSNQLLESYRPYIRKNIPHFGIKSLGFYCCQTQRALIFKYKYKTTKLVGCGRMLSRGLLEDVALRMEVKIQGPIQGFTKGSTCILSYKQASYFKAMDSVLFLSEKPNWSLWENTINRGLDNSCESYLVSQNYIPIVVPSEKILITDIKSSVNIWTFQSFIKLSTEVHPDQVLDFFSSKEKEHLSKV
ncbi:MAG TPA: hypothetical protein PKC30_08450 [Saprospiraceae bacterium]|nr:hypothetical protein [Saprospiraceae bacterium]